MSATIIAILGLLWTLFQSILLAFQIWAFFDGLFMRGERAEPATMLGFANSGITIAFFGILLLPYLKPVIMLGIRGVCALFGWQFVPVEAIDQGLGVASDLVRDGTAVAVNLGKKALGQTVAAKLQPAEPIHVVIDNWPPPAAGTVPAPAPQPAPAPAVTVNTNPGQTISSGAAK